MSKLIQIVKETVVDSLPPLIPGRIILDCNKVHKKINAPALIRGIGLYGLFAIEAQTISYIAYGAGLLEHEPRNAISLIVSGICMRELIYHTTQFIGNKFPSKYEDMKKKSEQIKAFEKPDINNE